MRKPNQVSSASEWLHGKLKPHRQLVRNVYPVLRPMLSVLGCLDAIARVHGTDKYLHRYTPIYERHFHDMRLKKLKVLEIRIGGGPDPREGGESLRMWKDYFPRAHIFGIDIRDKTGLAEPRIEIYQGDQSDQVFLHELALRLGPFDIVIDDGSHHSEHVITSFNALFPHVAEDGFYVIEDLFLSYEPRSGGSADPGDSRTSLGMLKALVDDIHYKYIPGYQPLRFGDRIDEIMFYPKLCFIHKMDNSSPDLFVDQFFERWRNET